MENFKILSPKETLTGRYLRFKLKLIHFSVKRFASLSITKPSATENLLSFLISCAPKLKIVVSMTCVTSRLVSHVTPHVSFVGTSSN